ncbi:MAG: V-type ATP synthase subunit F [Candidatus Woesearchaeota archaeon]|nr:V-type ATP synthase subunit F [Candidatus Woesearchaeota archaeon]
MDIAVIGPSEFTLGFRLSGINKVIEASGNQEKIDKLFYDAMADENLGIIITDNTTMDAMSERIRERAEASVKPVVIIVSTESTAQETLRKMIIKSIGVDLWKN